MSPLLEAVKVEPGNLVIILPPRREAMPRGRAELRIVQQSQEPNDIVRVLGSSCV